MESGTTAVLCFAKDRLGSTAAVTDGSWIVLEEYRHSAFWSPYRKLPDGTWEALGSETETLSGTVRPEPLTDRLYTGREWDSETGLHHYRARAYSPELGRFLQRDPAWQADQVNPYAYVRNDPENFTDPSGGVANFVVWAVANVAIWAWIEYVSAWREGREFSYSAKDALADAVSWAAWVGIAQKAARLWKLAKPLFESVANASANTLAAVIRSDCPKGRMTAGSVASLFWSQLVSQVTMRAQGAVMKKFMPKQKKILGWSYGKVRDNNKWGEVHHMPADSTSPLSKRKWPSIWMEEADHAKTASYGNRPWAQKYRDEQRALIEKWDMKSAIMMDVRDVKSKFWSRYDEWLDQALKYFYEINRK